MLRQFRQIKEKTLRGKSSGTRRGLMILKICLEMEWMLILGGDIGLYVYFVVVVGPRLLGILIKGAREQIALRHTGEKFQVFGQIPVTTRH
jgi:hypothetical protein